VIGPLMDFIIMKTPRKFGLTIIVHEMTFKDNC